MKRKGETIMVQNEKTDGTVKLSDDDLDGVSGGSIAGDNEELARSEGRTIRLPHEDACGVCACGDDQVWAASMQKLMPSKYPTYFDVKCYTCGHQDDSFRRIENSGPRQTPSTDGGR
jgi:hypothetical protein